MTEFLNANAPEDTELKKRPDLIAKRVPNQDQIVLIELKRPSVKLRPAHIGQILEYKGIIERYKPGTKRIDCFLFGYEKHPNFHVESQDVTIRTFSELACSLRDEYQAYLKVLEENAQRDEHVGEESDSDLPGTEI